MRNSVLFKGGEGSDTSLGRLVGSKRSAFTIEDTSSRSKRKRGLRGKFIR